MPRSEAADLASSPVPSVCSPYRVISLHLRSLLLLPALCQPVAPWSAPCLSRPVACRPWAWVSRDSQARGWQVPPAPRVLPYARRCPRFDLAVSVCFTFLFLFCVFFSHYATAVMLPKGSPRRAPVPLVIRARNSRPPLQPRLSSCDSVGRPPRPVCSGPRAPARLHCLHCLLSRRSRCPPGARHSGPTPVPVP